jgi:hypothetical protein
MGFLRYFGAVWKLKRPRAGIFLKARSQTCPRASDDAPPLQELPETPINNESRSAALDRWSDPEAFYG